MSDGEILINALPAAGSVTGNEILPGMQGMTTIGITTQQIADLAAALVRDGVPSNLDTLAKIVAAYLPLTGGTLTGTLQANTFVRVRAATELGQARLDLLRNNNTLAARCWHYGTSNAIAIDLYSTDGTTVLTRIELNGGTAGTVTIGGHVVVTAANIQSYLGTLLPDYVSGMAVSYVNGTTCSVAPGQARAGATAVELAAAMTKRLDASWTAGSGNGGLDTGVVQPNATYHLRVIRNSSTQAVDLLYSASASAPAMPSGWNSIRRLQAIKTDGSGAIRPFVTDGKETRLVTPVEEYSGGTRSLALLTCAGLPTGVRVQGIFRSFLLTSNSADGEVTHILGDGVTSSIQEQLRIYHATGLKGLTGQMRGYTDTSARVNFAVTVSAGHTAASNTLHTLGWIDHSIPRI